MLRTINLVSQELYDNGKVPSQPLPPFPAASKLQKEREKTKGRIRTGKKQQHRYGKWVTLKKV